jgi:VanZ family protein
VKLWPWWVVLVFVISAPWAGCDPDPHWERINWRPFHDPADQPRDAASNFLFYLPFGWSFVSGRRSRGVLMQAVAVAFVTSVAAEATQLFSTGRFPSATDVLMAVCGTLLGSMLVVLWEPRRSRHPPLTRT